jgi:hypothetical protein
MTERTEIHRPGVDPAGQSVILLNMTTTQKDTTMTYGLFAAETDRLIGPATPAQITASLDADETGWILIDADGDVVHDGSWSAQQTGVRTVYVAEVTA